MNEQWFNVLFLICLIFLPLVILLYYQLNKPQKIKHEFDLNNPDETHTGIYTTDRKGNTKEIIGLRFHCKYCGKTICVLDRYQMYKLSNSMKYGCKN